MRAFTQAVMAFATLAMPLSAFAAPSVSVTRTPSSWTVWDAYSVTWSTSWAVKLGYRCTWAWSNSADDLSASGLWLNGTVSGKYDESMVWTTNCVWTATAADGATANFSESFTTAKSSASPFSNFAISKIAATPYSGSAVVLANWARSFSIEGTGAPGANVIVSSAGCVYLNRSANADGSWAVTVTDDGSCKLPQGGAFQFSVTASRAYYGEAVRYATVVFPSSSAVEMGKIQCRTGGEYSETNIYAKRGESANCTVGASDGKTRLMMDSGYVSWGDVDSTKVVQPQSVSEIPTSCQGGVCTATFVSDYAGYSKNRNVWFQNSSGTKSALVSYVSADPGSQDYADAIAYLNKKYQSSQSTSQSSGTSTPVTAVKITSVSGARFWNGKITASEGVSFTVEGTAAKRSQMRIYRKGADSDGVSGGVDDSGKWSTYGLWTRWYPKVFKTGTYQYVFECTGADGKSTTSTVVEIEIVAAASANGSSSISTTGSPSSTTRPASSGDSPSSTKNSGTASTSAETRTQTSSKISPELKTKLDAFVVVLEKRATAKWDAKSSFEYVTAVREKLVILKAKYRKTWKNVSAAAIAYLIEKADAVALKFAPRESEEDSLVKDLKESY